MIYDRCGRDQPTVGGASRPGSPDWYKKVSHGQRTFLQGLGFIPASSDSPRLDSPRFPSVKECESQANPSPTPVCFWPWCFITVVESKLDRPRCQLDYVRRKAPLPKSPLPSGNSVRLCTPRPFSPSCGHSPGHIQLLMDRG